MSKPKSPEQKKLRMAAPKEDPLESTMYEVVQRISGAHILSEESVTEILEMYLKTLRIRLLENGTDYLPGVGTIRVARPALGEETSGRPRTTIKMDKDFLRLVMEQRELLQQQTPAKES